MLIFMLLFSRVSANLFVLDQESCYCDNIDILELTTEMAQDYFLDGILTPHRLVDCYMNRIELMNPGLGNIIEVSNEAKQYAGQLSLEQMTPEKPLYGIPVIVSGNIMTKEFMSTTLNHVHIINSEKRDAAIAKLLREAGAIIIGKARSDVRQFPNPYYLRHNNTGCSAGSAVASNLAMLAVSVEPSFFSLTSASELSLTAIKLTQDDVSMSDILITQPSQSSIVALARNVVDCLKLFKTLSKKTQGIPLNQVTPEETELYLDLVLRSPFTKVAGFASDDLFGYFHRTQVPNIRDLKKRLKTNTRTTDGFNLSKDSKLCLRSSYLYYRSSQIGSESDIETALTNLKCTTDDKLKLETIKRIEDSINSSKVDALILPYPVVAFLPQLPVMTVPSGYCENGLPYGITLTTKKSWVLNLFNIVYRIENQGSIYRVEPRYLN